jgi:hypothetical protein
MSLVFVVGRPRFQLVKEVHQLGGALLSSKPQHVSPDYNQTTHHTLFASFRKQIYRLASKITGLPNTTAGHDFLTRPTHWKLPIVVRVCESSGQAFYGHLLFVGEVP